MDLEQFLKLNGIDMRDFIEANDSPDLVVYEKYDNSIANYAMYGNYEAENVDISSVIGIPRHLIQRKSVVEKIFFCKNCNEFSFKKSFFNLVKHPNSSGISSI